MNMQKQDHRAFNLNILKDNEHFKLILHKRNFQEREQDELSCV